jgi:hypothetical protein
MLLPRSGLSYLVEVDVHALELEVGSTVVPVACQMNFLALLCCR